MSLLFMIAALVCAGVVGVTVATVRSDTRRHRSWSSAYEAWEATGEAQDGWSSGFIWSRSRVSSPGAGRNRPQDWESLAGARPTQPANGAANGGSGDVEDVENVDDAVAQYVEELERQESELAAETSRCCWVIRDDGWDGSRTLCGNGIQPGYIFCPAHLFDVHEGGDDPERFAFESLDLVEDYADPSDGVFNPAAYEAAAFPEDQESLPSPPPAAPAAPTAPLALSAHPAPAAPSRAPTAGPASTAEPGAFTLGGFLVPYQREQDDR